MNKILDSILPVIEKSEFIRFDAVATQQFANQKLKNTLQPPQWENDIHYNDGTETTLLYLIVLDALNFCFWDVEPRWRIQHMNQKLDGYVALAACLKQAFERDSSWHDTQFLSTMTYEDTEKLLAGENTIPMLLERWRGLQEVGSVLLEKFDGRTENLVEAAKGSALRLVDLLAEHFPSFRDEVDYFGHRVYFYKRAQIFCADVYGAFGGTGWGAFDDIGHLTAFADYKLPQLLRANGVLIYKRALAKRVDAQQPLVAGSPEEVEIRAHTLHAVEQLKLMFAQAGVCLNSIEIDWLLWHWSQGIQAAPYHRTRTIYY